jgi:hypothetical protein
MTPLDQPSSMTPNEAMVRKQLRSASDIKEIGSPRIVMDEAILEKDS